MRTEDCELACSTAIALNQKTIDKLHAGCPGGFRDPEGWAHPCDCKCHAGVILDLNADSVLPVRTVPVSAPAPVDPPQNRAAPARAGGRRCLCGCGEEVSPTARFRPGHDAKLKSRLVADAREGINPTADLARRRLEELGWSHFI